MRYADRTRRGGCSRAIWMVGSAGLCAFAVVAAMYPAMRRESAAQWALTDAVNSRSQSGVDAALAAGASPNATCWLGSNRTAHGRLFNAAFNNGGHWDTPLALAFHRGDAGIARSLFAHGATLNELSPGGLTPEFAAAMGGNLECLQMAMAHGARADEVFPDCVDARVGRRARERVSGTYGIGRVALLEQAVLSSQVPAVRYLLEHGANVNVYGDRGARFLNWAAAIPSENGLVELLLRAGADPNAAYGGRPPLVVAGGGAASGIRALLKRGVPVDARDGTGATALLVAARSRWPVDENLKLLLGAGAHVNVAMPDGTTPLLEAVRAGNGGTVRLLLQHGADPYRPDQAGHCSADFANDPHAGKAGVVMGEWLNTHRKP